MNDPRLKIALFDPTANGGICHYTFHLAESLAAAGAEVTVFTDAANELAGWKRSFEMHFIFRRSRVKAWLDRLAPGRAGCRAQARPRPAYGAPGLFLRLRRLGRLAKAVCLLLWRRPAVVHFLWLENRAQDFRFMRLLKLLGFQIFYTAHNVLPHNNESALVAEFFRRVYGAADRIIVHAADNKREMIARLGVDPEKILVIPHGVYDRLCAPAGARPTARRRLGIGTGAKVILFFGVIRRHKGLDILLDAFDAVREQIPEAVLLVAGKGGAQDPGLRDYYSELRRRLLAAPRVMFIEDYIPVQALGCYFAAADLVVLPYRKVYQSGVLFLAYAAGRPVVVTDTGGLAEAVENGRNGFVVPPERSAPLADAIVELLRDSARRRAMGRHARRLGATVYSWQGIAAATLAAYRAHLGWPLMAAPAPAQLGRGLAAAEREQKRA